MFNQYYQNKFIKNILKFNRENFVKKFNSKIDESNHKLDLNRKCLHLRTLSIEKIVLNFYYLIILQIVNKYEF